MSALMRYRTAASSDAEAGDWGCLLRVRHYDPTVGRFSSMDPYSGNMGDPSQWMRYGYAGANPVANADPSGMMSLAAGLGVIGITALGVSIALPAFRGGIRNAYHVGADGSIHSLVGATFGGEATWEDWKRSIRGFGSGAQAGAINALDKLSFTLIDPLHNYKDSLWVAEGLNESWIGTFSNGFAWAGTAALYSAAAVWVWSAAGGGTMSIAISRGPSPWFAHVRYGANGHWQEAVLGTGRSGLGGMTIVNTPSGWVTGTQITGIPVLFPAAVTVNTAEAGFAFSCVTAAMRAFLRGWGI